MRIALLAYHFAPDPAIGAVRPTNWAEWLSESHDVTVVTRKGTSTPDAGSSASVIRPRSRCIEIVDRLQAARVHRRVRNASRQWRSGPERPAEHCPTGALTYRMPCLYDLWARTAYRALCQIRPDVVIATHSPYISLVVAALYAARHRHTRLWLDFRDMWTYGHTTRGLPLLATIERGIERRALRQAAVVTTVSERLCENLATRSGVCRPRLVYNSPAHAAAAFATHRPSGRPFTLCYTGNIYPWQDMSPLFRMLHGLTTTSGITPADVRVQVASRLPGDVAATAARLGVSAFLDYRGCLSRQDCLTMQRDADVLVVMESAAPEADGVLTGKVFEYLATTKPLLLLGPGPQSELYRLIDRHDRLIPLEQVRDAVERRRLPAAGRAVDYSAIARSQLLDCLESLATQPRLHGQAA
ncbi:MAG: glycosyltransferase [Planctomycetota bacterium]